MDNSNEAVLFDEDYDYDRIIASFAQQYGIRLLSDQTLTVREYLAMLSCLSPDSPLGQVIEIRSSERPQELTSQARVLRSKWFIWLAENRKGALAPITSFKQALGR